MKITFSEIIHKRKLIAPSILSADFARLGAEIADVENGTADWIHVDVMDGHFVPNLTMGPALVKSIRPTTGLPLDCHLMVQNPEQWVEPFAKAGADVITVHAEVLNGDVSVLKRIREVGCLAGISLNPDTPCEALKPFFGEFDLVLIMSVFPGFSGQSFIASSLNKVRELDQHPSRDSFLIEMDGGIGLKNIKEVSEAGCDVMVAGSAVFSKENRSEVIQQLREESRC